MAKAGRKRKTGRREPNGRVTRVAAADAMRVVALSQPHRRALPEEARRDQRAESALGRLFLAGRISQAQCEAGERLAARKRAFSQALASPGGVARSWAGRMVASTFSSDDAPQDQRTPGVEANAETEAERRAAALAHWDEAETCVWDGVGRVKERFAAVIAVVVEGRDIAGAGRAACVELDWLRMGLSALARLWALDEEGEAGAPGLRPMRLAIGGREVWRLGKAKN